MLPKNRRIHKNEFPVNKKTTIFWRGTNLRVIKIPTEGISTFAVVVSKKHAKNAVERNRFRRQVYTTIAKQLKERNTQQEGWKHILFPVKDLSKITQKDIQKEINQIFTQQNT